MAAFSGAGQPWYYSMIQTRSYWDSDLVHPSGNEKRAVDMDIMSITCNINDMETRLLLEADSVYW